MNISGCNAKIQARIDKLDRRRVFPGDIIPGHDIPGRKHLLHSRASAHTEA
jgi:hypothetical protein